MILTEAHGVVVPRTAKRACQLQRPPPSHDPRPTFRLLPSTRHWLQISRVWYMLLHLSSDRRDVLHILFYPASLRPKPSRFLYHES